MPLSAIEPLVKNYYFINQTKNNIRHIYEREIYLNDGQVLWNRRRHLEDVIEEPDYIPTLQKTLCESICNLRVIIS